MNDIRHISGLWCDDITFCPEKCGEKSCPRNKQNIRDRTIPHSFSVEIPGDCPKRQEGGEVSMGCIDTVTAYKFPKQSEYVNRRCKVCFHYNTNKWIMGTVIRDDREEPYETLIRLDDGRTIRGVECQYSFSIPMQEG